jgi:molecular chaperone GrpE
MSGEKREPSRPAEPAGEHEPGRDDAAGEAATPVGVPEGDPVASDFADETAKADRLSAPAEPDYKDRWLRAEAELQNTRRRLLRERDEAIRAREDRVLLDLIDLLDDLERALAARPDQAQDGWAQGVALTAQRMRDTLARHGVVPVPAVGERFDPAMHEAILEIPATQGTTPGHVAQEVLRGYRRGDRALRPARVVVARLDP